MPAELFKAQDMKDPKASEHFDKAAKDIRDANQELYKPEEDVVSFVVCNNSLGAIENYLKGYLASRGYTTSSEETIGQLMERCRMLDKNFHKIQIEAIDCRNTKADNLHCDEMSKLSACYQVADQLENLLLKKGIL